MTILEVEIPVDDGQDEKVSCPVCSKAVSPRGLTRHLNAAHPDSSEAQSVTEKVKQRTRGKGRRGRKTKGLSQEVSDGLASMAGKLLVLLTLLWAWSTLRRMGVPDPTGDYADDMSLTDDESVAIGRVLARFFASSEPGRRLAPVIVENEDVVDAAFAMADWYKRNRLIMDELQRRQIPTTGGNGHGSYGPTGEYRPESASPGDAGGYVPPAPQDILGA